MYVELVMIMFSLIFFPFFLQIFAHYENQPEQTEAHVLQRGGSIIGFYVASFGVARLAAGVVCGCALEFHQGSRISQAAAHHDPIYKDGKLPFISGSLCLCIRLH